MIEIMICEYDAQTMTQHTRPATPEEIAAMQHKRVPQQASRKACLLALATAGLLVPVQMYIASLDEPQRTLTTIEWEDSVSFYRNSGIVLAAASGLGLTSDQLDDLFIAASALE